MSTAAAGGRPVVADPFPVAKAADAVPVTRSAATSAVTSAAKILLEMALSTRARAMAPALGTTAMPVPRGHTSIASTEWLVEAGIDPSVGTVGDAFDNALAESVIGLCKKEFMRCREPGAGSMPSSP
jgi:putative transposase